MTTKKKLSRKAKVKFKELCKELERQTNEYNNAKDDIEELLLLGAINYTLERTIKLLKEDLGL